MTPQVEASLVRSLGAVLEYHRMRPQDALLRALVREHHEAFVRDLLAQFGLQDNAEGAFAAYVRSLDDPDVMEFVVRHQAALLEKLRTDEDLPEVSL